MPGPHGGRHGYQKPQNPGKTFLRIVKYMTDSKLRIAVVVVAVIISSCTNIVGTYFLKPLINDYIVPFIGQQDVNFAPFIGMLCVLGAIYLTGALCTYISTGLW